MDGASWGRGAAPSLPGHPFSPDFQKGSRGWGKGAFRCLLEAAFAQGWDSRTYVVVNSLMLEKQVRLEPT